MLTTRKVFPALPRVTRGYVTTLLNNSELVAWLHFNSLAVKREYNVTNNEVSIKHEIGVKLQRH